MSATEAIGGMIERVDGWFNELLGLGSRRDPSKLTSFTSRGRGIAEETLDAMYAEDHYAARVIELVVKHGMRKGWDIRLPGNPQEAAEASRLFAVEEEALHVAAQFAIGAMWGRLFGGLTWIGIDDGLGDAQWAARQEDPIDTKAIQRVRFLHSFDSRECVVVDSYGDPRQVGYRKPSKYRITPSSLVGPEAALASAEIMAGGIVVHESRLIVWPGQITSSRRLGERQGWDDSVLERSWEALRQAGEDQGAKSKLLTRISQFVFKIKNLGSLITTSEEKFRRRMALIDTARARGGSLVIDTEENVENIAQPVSGIEGMIDKSIERVAMSGGIPPSVFVGRPTPEDLDVWDAEVEDWQTNVLKPRHEKVAQYILLSKQGPTKGIEPATWAIEYRPLRTPKPTERATLRKLQAETDAIEIDKGVMPPEAVALHRHTGNAHGTGEVQLDPVEVAAALQRRRELASKPPKDNAELGTVSARAGGGVLEALGKLNRGEITRGQCKQLLVGTFTMTPEDAETQMGDEREVLELRASLAPTPSKPGPAPGPQTGTGAGAPQGLSGVDDGGDPKTKALPIEGAQ